MTLEEAVTYYTRRKTPPTVSEIAYTASIGGFAPRALWDRLRSEGVRVVKGPAR